MSAAGRKRPSVSGRFEAETLTQPPAFQRALAARRPGAGEGLDGHLLRLVTDLDGHAVVDHHADMVVAEEQVAPAQWRPFRQRLTERALLRGVARTIDAAKLQRQLDQPRTVDTVA